MTGFCQTICLLGAVAAAIWLGSGTSVGAAGGGICDQAASNASRETGVPLEILMAVTRAETGRSVNKTLQPWPWTTNDAGKGRWFETRELAQAHIRRQHSMGLKNFDIGCFQINFRWHGTEFSSIEEMLEPEANALYAARFLAELQQEKGNWEDAVAAYHSRTPEHADRYRKRFTRILSRLSVDPALPKAAHFASHNAKAVTGAQNGSQPDEKRRKNAFPLIRATAHARPVMGSLVALPDTSKPALISLEGG